MNRFKIIERIPKFIEKNQEPRVFYTFDSFSLFLIDWIKKINPERIEIMEMIDPVGFVIENEYQIFLFKGDDLFNIASLYCSNEDLNDFKQKIKNFGI